MMFVMPEMACAPKKESGDYGPAAPAMAIAASAL
jgi:hypothetical protein